MNSHSLSSSFDMTDIDFISILSKINIIKQYISNTSLRLNNEYVDRF
jgi:hypothetical protein